MLVIKLYHGRRHPDEELEDWGSEGPELRIRNVHWTYFTTMKLACKYSTLFVGLWSPGENDGTIIEDLFYYDGIFYGDFTIYEIESIEKSKEIPWFEPEKAILDKNTALPPWETIKCK